MTKPVLPRPMGAACAVAYALALSSFSAQAQRDPTRPPQAPAPAGNASAAGLPVAPLAVIVRDGRAHVVVGTRLYAQGERLGAATIERIDETEIWLREGKTLHKIPRFVGVRRTAIP